MLPTINIFDKFKFVFFSAKWSLINPFTFSVVFATAIASLVTWVCGQFNLITFNTLQDSQFFAPNSELKSLILYVIASDHLIPIVDTAVNIVKISVASVPAFFVSLWAASMIFAKSKLIQDCFLKWSK